MYPHNRDGWYPPEWMMIALFWGTTILQVTIRWTEGWTEYDNTSTDTCIYLYTTFDVVTGFAASCCCLSPVYMGVEHEKSRVEKCCENFLTDESQVLQEEVQKRPFFSCSSCWRKTVLVWNKYLIMKQQNGVLKLKNSSLTLATLSLSIRIY